MANDWFSSYLTNRSLVAKITSPSSNITYSEPFKITYGTAQGSCLGPLLFILFCNDIHNLPLNSCVILFADDATLFNSHKSHNYLQFSLEHDMLLLTEWFSVNQLSLNMEKTVPIKYWPNLKPNARPFKLSVNGIDIKVVEYSKFLGVYVDHELNWKKHCSIVYNKLPANRHLLTMAHNLLNCDCLIKTYYAHLIIWSPDLCIEYLGQYVHPKDIDSIFKLQKSYIRSVYKTKKDTHTDPLFKKSCILKFPEMIKLELLKLGHKVCRKNLPKPILHLYRKNGGQKMHRYPTHNKNIPNIQQQSGCTMGNSFLCRSIALYQKLPYKLKQLENLHHFTKDVKKYLMSNDFKAYQI